MNLKRANTTLLAIIATAFTPIVAHAHPGHNVAELSSIADGITHPFTGLDHLLLALAIGVWIAFSNGTLRKFLPVSFLIGGIAGALGGNLLGAFSGLEICVTAAALAIGCLALRDLRMGTSLSCVLAGVCTFFHGWAHGAEVPASIPASNYLGGVLLGTIFISMIGFSVGRLFARSNFTAGRKAGA